MTIKVAINGYGRIGRCVLRAIFEAQREKTFEIVAINDTAGIQSTAHFTQFDSTHGRFNAKVSIDNNHLVINGQRILVLSEREPERLPWQSLQVDILLECTGRFTSKTEAMRHVKSGAKKVLISAPGEDPDATIVYGINHQDLRANHIVISNASCTTNCLAPLAKPLHEHLGIEQGLVNTVHAYTKDQLLLDGNHKDFQRARAAAHSIIPTKTGAAKAIGLVLPELAGKLDGFALRVPVLNVSTVDLTFTASRSTTVEEVNQILSLAADNQVLYVNDLPLVSCDFNHHPASAIVDLKQTKVIDRLVKVIAWYDNEWGFANRMLDTAYCMFNC
ncbi:MAG: type I glyceraldehyde-3-phosphate dehydrogenase [Gammaproteobacteria bacterium]|nr:type I glyceraldehyde-3-phosphate dehydrogenase [Gammaproteobacteria bacterium]